jgi:hypothetical protein
MKRAWLPYAILRVASWLAPEYQRALWLEEWHSELWYIDRRRATLFCLGAFRDALWLRRNNLNPVTRSLVHPESPIQCLAVLAATAVVSMLITVCLSGPLRSKPLYSHVGAWDLLFGCIATLGLSCLLLPGALVVGRSPANRYPVPWPSRLFRGIFLVLKISLVQPVLVALFVVWILLAPVAPLAPYLLMAACIMALRWVFTDQRRRCPVCLRLLTNPVRIGSPSETFLQWYGAESMCSRGHGLLHISEISASYSGKPQWIHLDDSWKGLFSEAAGVRQR